jgi:WD40 repeat protein
MYVASGSWDGTARIWEATTAKELARLVHDAGVTSVAFSPNGEYLLSGSADHTTRLWIWQPSDLIAYVCAYVPRNLTHAKWKQYIGDALPYQAICDNLSLEPEPTAIPTQ